MKIQFHIIWYWICLEYDYDKSLNDIAEKQGYSEPNLRKLSLLVWKRMIKKKINMTIGTKGE